MLRWHVFVDCRAGIGAKGSLSFHWELYVCVSIIWKLFGASVFERWRTYITIWVHLHSVEAQLSFHCITYRFLSINYILISRDLLMLIVWKVPTLRLSHLNELRTWHCTNIMSTSLWTRQIVVIIRESLTTVQYLLNIFGKSYIHWISFNLG